MKKINFKTIRAWIGNWKPFLGSYLIPVGISCCISVFFCCPIKTAFAVEGQIIPEDGCSSNNFGNRTPNFVVNFVGGYVNGNSRINILKGIHNLTSEFYRSVSESIFSVVEASEIEPNCRHNESARYLWDMSPCELHQIIHKFATGLMLCMV